jgi:tRNA A-37 threonylcarbamoyl transferase component Bud32
MSKTSQTEYIDNMKILGKLGSRGKDAQVYEVKHKNKSIALKAFRKNKNINGIKNEYEFLKKTYKLGISPKVYSINTEKKYITMEKMEETLFSHIKKTGKMTNKEQNDMIEILEILDVNDIFHGDISPSNFIFDKDHRLYIIDYGMTKEITPQFIKKNGEDSNTKLGITFFILRVREIFPDFEPKILLKKVHSLLNI